MLAALYIENLAVIEKTYVEFPRGFTVFTGETGAGKSILIDAINACLGQRTTREIVRTGAEKASISAVFREIPRDAADMLAKNGYSVEEGGELLLDRTIHADGRTIARVNGRPAAVGFLREIGTRLINIHGQHDSQTLLSPEKHLGLLDNFGGLHEEAAAYQEKFLALRDTVRKLKALSAKETGNSKRAEMLRFQIEEIRAAKLTPGIEERLMEKSRRFQSVERIARALESACVSLLGDEEELQGAVDLVEAAQGEMSALSEFSEFSAAAETLEGISLELSELSATLRGQLSALEYDQQEADLVEARLSQIHRLKLKYGSTVSEILDFMEDAKRELAGIESGDEQLRELTKQAALQKKEVARLAALLTEHRKEAAARFVEKVSGEARFLEMPNLRMEADFRPAKLGIQGDHTMELLISANPGEPPKPISKIASGGELSRIMLAIKSALAEKDDVDTLIFDEIDTGVSGRAAQKIGMKLREVGASRQVFCVTHSAQVASQGDSQFLIRKSSDKEKTFTEVLPLDMEGRVAEIARIMATDQVSGLARETARRMLEENQTPAD
ncbi:MAG TPA: DNA repair protein RecN [Candidatus Merdivicinus intestinigallinarum]|nr:DNA repair protein RecN [Candidatus Merdivicinus intestinigallinarum]